MEVLDEFDREFPQSVTFCRLISEADFERQAATCTERALRRLFRALDRNPRLAERVVRKDKLAECERRGLLSFLWAKLLCAVQGDLNLCNSMGALELHQRLELLKRRIHRVHQYSQDAKKKRKPNPKKSKTILLGDQPASPCLPPALSPSPTTMASAVTSSPPVYTMPRVFGPFPPGETVYTSSIALASTGIIVVTDSRPEKNLRHGGVSTSRTSACSGPSNTNATPSRGGKASVSSLPVPLKFQPVHRSRDDPENDPGSAESMPAKRSQ